MSQKQQYQPSPALGRLMAGVALMATKHTQVDWHIAALNVPLFVLTYGLVALNTDDRKALASTPMPDAWVCAAAELPGAAPKSLGSLRQAFDRQGFVSIEDADKFCTVELAREQEVVEQNVRADAQEHIRSSAGYQALVQRLARSDSTLTPEQAYVTLRGRVRDLADAGAGLPSLAADKASWLVSSVGSAVGKLVRAQ